MKEEPKQTAPYGSDPTEQSASRLEVQNLRWSNAEETQASIVCLYQYAEAHANDAIAWYAKHKSNKAFMSRTLRFWAILWTTFGGLTPIIGSLGWHTVRVPDADLTLNVGQFGYLFLGLAAACVGLDRFFGFSGGWMRYITTMMTLERALSGFRFDWAMMVAKLGEKAPTSDQVQLKTCV